MAGGRAALTATAIENAALDLALASGYDSVTVDMICERVGISQRTFFNHFPAKDDALLGRGKPQLDERAARHFILGDGPILIDALALIHIPRDGDVPQRMSERMRVVSTSPQLLTRQMERFTAIENEITEVIALRVKRHRPEAPEADRQREASLTTHLLVGVIRWAAAQVEGGGSEAESFGEAVALARETLLRAFTDSNASPTAS